MVVGVTIRLAQTLTGREVMKLHVDVTGWEEIGVDEVEVENRHGREPAAAVHDESGLVRGLRGSFVGDHPLRNEVGVDVETTDLLVQIEELSGAYLSGVQRGQAVLNADIIEWPAREAPRVAAKDVDVVIVRCRPGARRIRCRVVASAERNDVVVQPRRLRREPRTVRDGIDPGRP